MVTYYIDGSNVCFWKGIKAFDLSPLLNLCIEIKKRGDDFVCIFDASIRSKRYRTDEERKTIEKLIDGFGELFNEATGGMKAEDFILIHADYDNALIITNDLYRDYTITYPWLKNSKRLLKGGIMTKNGVDVLAIPQLKIRLPVEKDIEKLFYDLKTVSEKKIIEKVIPSTPLPKIQETAPKKEIKEKPLPNNESDLVELIIVTYKKIAISIRGNQWVNLGRIKELLVGDGYKVTGRISRLINKFPKYFELNQNHNRMKLTDKVREFVKEANI